MPVGGHVQIYPACRLYARRAVARRRPLHASVSLARFNSRLIHGEQSCHMDVQMKLYSSSSFEASKLPDGQRRRIRLFSGELWLSEVRRIPRTRVVPLLNRNVVM
jgi:hypothetical protein